MHWAKPSYCHGIKLHAGSHDTSAAGLNKTASMMTICVWTSVNQNSRGACHVKPQNCSACSPRTGVVRTLRLGSKRLPARAVPAGKAVMLLCQGGMPVRWEGHGSAGSPDHGGVQLHGINVHAGKVMVEGKG